MTLNHDLQFPGEDVTGPEFLTNLSQYAEASTGLFNSSDEPLTTVPFMFQAYTSGGNQVLRMRDSTDFEWKTILPNLTEVYGGLQTTFDARYLSRLEVYGHSQPTLSARPPNWTTLSSHLTGRIGNASAFNGSNEFIVPKTGWYRVTMTGRQVGSGAPYTLKHAAFNAGPTTDPEGFVWRVFEGRPAEPNTVVASCSTYFFYTIAQIISPRVYADVAFDMSNFRVVYEYVAA